MRIFEVILIVALLLTAIIARATDYYERFFITSNDTMYVTDMEFNIQETVDLPSDTEAVTFDGERWWMVYNDSEIYAFDLNGDYITSFPAPREGIRGMAWDGECIWMVSSDTSESIWYFYERYPDGGVGPHGDFTFSALPPATGLAYGEGQLLALIGLNVSYHVFYRNGDYVGWGEFRSGFGGFWDGRGICYADTDYDFWEFGGPYFFVICEGPGRRYDYIPVAIFPDTGDEDWIPGGILHDTDGDGSGIAYGKIQYDTIIEESFGKIKAYFANE
jgi:hypothetical protein